MADTISITALILSLTGVASLIMVILQMYGVMDSGSQFVTELKSTNPDGIAPNARLIDFDNTSGFLIKNSGTSTVFSATAVDDPNGESKRPIMELKHTGQVRFEKPLLVAGLGTEGVDNVGQIILRRDASDVGLWNDATNTYFFTKAATDTKITDLRPFYFNNTSGVVTMQHGVTVASGLVSNLDGSQHQLSLKAGQSEVWLRNDGTDFYFLVKKSANSESVAPWEAIYPMSINNTSGHVDMKQGLTLRGMDSPYAQLSIVEGASEVMIRNDGSRTFFLSKPTGDAGFGVPRPFHFSNATGLVTATNGLQVGSEILATPSTTEAGMMKWNTDLGKLQVWNGTSWQTITSA